MRIGIDLMGGESSPGELFQAVLAVAKELDAKVALVVVCLETIIDELAATDRQTRPASSSSATIEFIPCQEVVTMDDDPLLAVRRKKHSSLSIGMDLLKSRTVDAFVSTGNTGALVASAVLSLSRLPQIERPALLATLPTQKGSVAVLDVGANVSCKPEHFLQFAQMGAVYQRCNEGIEVPTIGLLNIGTESQKGSEVHQQAYALLQKGCTSESKMSFLGNIEGCDVFRGGVDVLVTDGFAGNVFLKTSEGVSSFILDYLKQAFASISSPDVNQVLHRLNHRLNYAEYPGAVLCGVDGIAIKCHGNSSSQAMRNGIKGALHLIQNDVLSKMKTSLETRE